MELVLTTAPIVIVALFVVLVGVPHVRRYLVRGALSVVADTLQLRTLSKGFDLPALLGDHNGHVIKIYLYPSVSARRTVLATSVEAYLPFRSDFTLAFYREGVIAKAGKLLGTQDVELGAAEFDETFIIKSNEPEAVSDVLPQRVRDAALAVPGPFKVSVSDGYVRWERLGAERNAQTLIAVAKLVVEIARRVPRGTRSAG